MRIIAGTAHGQPIKAPAGRNTRPTTDRVREAIFSALTPFLAEAKVLDAFAGSGALGLEALSRGAAQAVFCEQARAAQIVPYGLVLLDPPYNKGLIAKIEPLLLADGFLAAGALVMLETAAKEPELLADSRWQLLKNRVYGDTAVYYWELID